MQDLERLNMAEGEQGIKKPIVMPDVFKCDIKEDWEDWIESFKACAEINSWDDNLKCKFLGVREKGTKKHLCVYCLPFLISFLRPCRVI